MTVLSVLDQGPVRADGGPRAALDDSLAVAAELDTAGYARYWVAEHHGTASRAIAAPEILIGPLAAATSRLHIGAGGIMLPNHNALHVAEQFRALHALHPGRIDLGVGRATGANNVTTAAALGRTDTDDAADKAAFDRQLRALLAFGDLRPRTGDQGAIEVMPSDAPLPPVFLLGASAASAAHAAGHGLPYALSAGFRDPRIAVDALRRYRELFTPAVPGDRPYAILVLRAWVGSDAEHAEAIAAPERLANVQQLAGDPQPLRPVEQALAHRDSDSERAVRDGLDLRADLVGPADEVAGRLFALARDSGADEVMVVTNTHARADRIASFRLLAAAAAALPV